MDYEASKSSDPELSILGQQQAAALAAGVQRYADLFATLLPGSAAPLDAVLVCSPMVRAIETRE